ncbi:MAG: XRE family transcriptional regulator [Lachnospiraceae bacterium]|nr:XRE family transcriptional regulator [Lachnospiraceae bacterium]
MSNWKEFRNELNISPEEESAIELEKELIRTLVEIRENRGMTQAEVASLCEVKQPVIARMEKATHSPQVDSLLKILVPLGYKLAIVPLSEKTR